LIAFVFLFGFRKKFDGQRAIFSPKIVFDGQKEIN